MRRWTDPLYWIAVGTLVLILAVVVARAALALPLPAEDLAWVELYHHRLDLDALADLNGPYRQEMPHDHPVVQDQPTRVAAPPLAPADLRALVVGGRVIAAIRRTAAAGEFRANLHLGGTAAAETLHPAEALLARRAAAVAGLDVAGVDLVRSHAGPLVIEVNASPGLEGVETATGVDVADAIVARLEARATV